MELAENFFSQNKPIGASPRRDYVQTRMVLLYEYNLVLYFMVRNDTLKKGGNAPRATDEKRILSSASLILKGSIVLLSQYKVWYLFKHHTRLANTFQHGFKGFFKLSLL